MFARIAWVWDWSSEAWTAIAAWTTAAVAATAALFARRQVHEVRRTREEQAQPFIVVDFEPSEVSSKLMNLIIRNSGQTLAKNVKLLFEPPLQTTMTKHGSDFDPAEASLIKSGIPAMPPRREYAILFEEMPDFYASDLPRRYEVTVTYCDSRNRSYKLTYPLDLGIYFGAVHVEAFGLHHAAKALRDIRSETSRWTAHSDGIRVWVRDDDKYLAEQRSDFERWKEQQQANDQEAKEQQAEQDLPVTTAGAADPDDPQIRT